MITPEELGERYLAVHHRMFRAVIDEMSGGGLSLARTKVLTRLKEQGPTRQTRTAGPSSWPSPTRARPAWA